MYSNVYESFRHSYLALGNPTKDTRPFKRLKQEALAFCKATGENYEDLKASCFYPGDWL